MIRRCIATIACLAGVLIAYATYALTAASTLEPPYLKTAKSSDNELWQAAASTHREALKKLFPPDAWQLQQPKTIESSNGILLFQEYKRDGEDLIIKPCTYVIFEKNKTGNQQPARIITLHAPNGAVLSNDILNSVDNSDSIPAGRLIGDVLIHSTESEAGAGDAFRFKTRNIQFQKNRIWTTHDVDFQYAHHEGKGRDMVINLKEIEPTRTVNPVKNPFSRIDFIELIDVDYVRLQLQQNLFEKSDRPRGTAKPAEMMIHCQGPFRIDFSNSLLTLEDQVDVTVSRDGQPEDQLLCERLDLTFSLPHQSPQQEPQDAVLDNNQLFEFQRITAAGNPLTIESPTQQLSIRGQTISFDMVQGTFSIEDAQQSLIKIHDHSFEVARFYYQMPPDPARLGQFMATGAGSYRTTLAGSHKEQINVTWKRDCKLEKRNDEHILSLDGKAEISFSNAGTISSDRIHIWLAESVKPQNDSSEADPGYQIIPTKLAAIGDVLFDTAEIKAATQRAEVWFAYDKNGAAESPDDPSIEVPLNRELNPKPNPRRYVVHGELIRIQLMQQKEKQVLQGAYIAGNLSLRQESSEAGSRSPFVLHGDTVELRRDFNGLFEMTLVGNEERGQPAWVSFEDFQVSGNTIKFNQPQNLMWIPGAGEIAFAYGNSEDANTMKRISWKEQMAFNGSVMELYGDVKTRGIFETNQGDTYDLALDCGVLQAQLNKLVNFSAFHSNVPVEIHLLTCRNQIAIQSRTLDSEKLQQAYHQMQAENLTFFPNSGAIESAGKGWIRSVFRNNGKTLGIDPGQPAQVNASQTPLQSFYVKFNSGLDGNVVNRHLTFNGKVESLFGPVENWDSKLNAESPAGLGPQGLEMTCEQLSIADITPTKTPTVVLSAIGNTYIESQQYVGLAHRITYSQAKNNLVMEGGRGTAKLWIDRNTSPTPNAAARKIIYSIGTGKIDLHSPNILDTGN